MLTPDDFTGRRYGTYEVLCRLAVGGMAEIFLGFPRSGLDPGRPIVIKRILAENSDDTAVAQFLEEARVTARLRGLHIARIVDLLNVNEEIILVIEFIRGVNLDELYESYDYVGQTIPSGFAAAIMRDAALGLVEAHNWNNDDGVKQAIIHRDVTPRNVMAGFDGVGRVLDFGIARVSGTSRRTAAGMVRGTSAYMSPEQAVGNDVDPRSDLFSLGIVFHELLTGKRLFRRTNANEEMKAAYGDVIVPPSQVNPKVPKAWDPLIMKLLTRELQNRMPTAQQTVDELLKIAGKDIWTREQIAAELKGRFSTRVQAIEAAVRRIPKHSLDTDRERKAVAPSPAARAGDSTILVTPKESAPRAGLTPDTSPAIPKPPGPMPRELADLPTAASDRATIPGATADETSKDMPVDVLANATILKSKGAPADSPLPPVILSPSAQVLPQVKKPKRTHTGELRPKQKPPARWPIVAAVVAALAVGAAAGKIVTLVQQNTPLGRVTIGTDRPALVSIKSQVLGPTPITTMLPEGKYTVRLKEPSGKTHALQVVVSEGAPVILDVALDSLAVVP